MGDIIRLEHDRLTGPGEYLASEGGVAARSILQPWQLLLCLLAGWMQREQQAVIEYLRTENQVLREHVRRKRLLLTDDQRRRLAPLTRVPSSVPCSQ